MSDLLHVEDSVATVTITGWVDRIKAYIPEQHWKWMPLVSVACGVIYALAAKPGSSSVSQKIMVGVMLGLTASGLFASVNQIGKAKKT